MKEALISIAIIVLYLYVSYLFYLKATKFKSTWFVVLAILLYFLGSYYYFEFISWAHYQLRDRGIYIEFGHASILLLELFFLCIIIAITNTILIIRKRSKQIGK
jgi:hypothetical protein